MAAVVATMVVGPLVKIVLQKASSSLLDQYKVMKGMEEQHDILKRKLLAILDIITDAEKVAALSAGAMAWLEAIKKVANHANEVFDEFKYEALRRKAKQEGNYTEHGIDVVKLFPTNNRFVFHNRMGRKLSKVVQTIEVLVNEMTAFGFKYQQQPPPFTQLRQTNNDIFDLAKIPSRSRAKDNEKIVDILVSQSNNADLTVAPIVGMGGLGKTTLAQLVYNEPEILKHFDLLLWVCVSDGIDVDSLAKSIVAAAPKKEDSMEGVAASKKKKTPLDIVQNVDSPDKSIVEAALQEKDSTEEVAASKKKNTPLDILQNVVSQKRYLLVLDDVWAREGRIWKQLKACLEHGGMGSVVLTTTRDEKVEEIMGTVEALEGQYIRKLSR